MSLAALLQKKLNKPTHTAVNADKAQGKLNRLPVGSTAQILATGETFAVVDRTKDTLTGEIYIWSDNRSYSLHDVEIDCKTWLDDFSNWKESDLQDVGRWLTLMGEDDCREWFEGLRECFCKEVLRASNPWISDRAKEVIRGWLK